MRCRSAAATFGASPRVLCVTSTIGSTDDLAYRHGAGTFLTPFAVYAAFLLATRAGIVHPGCVDAAARHRSCHRLAGADGGELSRTGGVRGLAARLDLRAGRTSRTASSRPADYAATTAPNLREAPWLKTGPVARLLALLNRDGEEARAVGGAVRNALMGLPVGEIDVATTALPEEIIRRVEAAGGKAIPTGIEHGTVTAVIGQRPIEITTLRKDVETFGLQGARRVRP